MQIIGGVSHTTRYDKSLTWTDGVQHT